MSAASLDERTSWRLHRRVALRPEPFGALAYHYDNRRLNFLRSPDLVRLVKSLGDHPTPRLAFDALGLDDGSWPAFRRALDALAASDFLEPIPSRPGTEHVDVVDDRPGPAVDQVADIEGAP